MTRKNRKLFHILPAIITLGILATTSSAMAISENGDATRLQKIISRLQPAEEGRSHKKPGRRLVLAADGIGQQNIVVDENHSIALGHLFDSGKLFLTPRGKVLLYDLGNALSTRELNDATYMIGGHTDARGDDNKNRELSEQRAQIVKRYLVRNFDIDPARLAVAGFGEDRLANPDSPNDEINRRVEVSLVTSGYTTAHRRARRAGYDEQSRRYQTAVSDRRSSSPAYDEGDDAAAAPLRPTPAPAYNTPAYAPPLYATPGYPAPAYQAPSLRPGYEHPAYDGPAHREQRSPALRRKASGYELGPFAGTSDLDDYGSVLALPPTTNRLYGGATGNPVCDSAAARLYDMRPISMGLDDYDARIPSVCPSFSTDLLSGKLFNGFKDGDDKELEK